MITVACLAMAIYFEARSEPLSGQAAVAHVILNRVEDRRWPSTACEVVTDRCQFSFWCDGKSETIRNPRAWRRASACAKLVLSGTLPDPTEGALYYHATYSKPYWRHHYQTTANIGRHIFYKEIQ